MIGAITSGTPSMLFRLLFLLFLLLPLKTEASVPEGAVIQDAEIEATLKSYVQPIFKVAGLNPKSLTIYIIHTQEVNAFAMAGGSLAVTTGLLLKAKSALQLIGVLAHETAHIAGNHVVRGGGSLRKGSHANDIGDSGGSCGRYCRKSRGRHGADFRKPRSC